MTETDFTRGNPDAGGLIHSYVPPTRDGCHKAKPVCGNGAFHLRWTDNKARVTCPACLAKL